MQIQLNGEEIGNIASEYQCDVVNFTSDKIVHDEIRGYLIWNDNEWDFVLPCTYKIIKECRNKDVKKIALILESPHKDEYDRVGSDFIPVAPAMGQTGIKIRGGLTKRPFISHLKNKYDYEIKLMNAVQYQCSCYNYIDELNRIDKKLRDEVFRLLFEKLEQDFCSRIENYSPDIIVNACTGGEIEDEHHPKKETSSEEKHQLNWYVDKKLKNETISKEYISGKNYYVDTHPISWK